MAEASTEWDAWLSSSLAGLHSGNLFRTLRPTVPGTSAVEVSVPAADLAAWVAGRPVPPQGTLAAALADGSVEAATAAAGQQSTMRTVKLFSLNDYLGLSTHPEVCRAASEAALACGNGPRSSALVGGYTCWHRDLETGLARLKGTQECLLFPTGFAANLAVVSSLCRDGDVAIFSDELNHASIVDGARLGRRGGTGLSVYRHNDLAHLEQLLAAAPPGKRKLVVTDTLFSMDGDFADLPGLAALKARHNFLLAVDDAHGTLVCGESGAGVAEMQGAEAAVDLHVGTLSKAFGCLGGFVACSARWKDFLVNRGRAQVFSTALPVPVVAAAHAALRVAEQEPWRREHLWSLTQQLGASLGVAAQSPIVPLVIGPEDATLGAAAQLLGRGLHVPAIRPPTVPAGTSRLRVSLSAAHTAADIEELVAAIQDSEVRYWELDALAAAGGRSAAQQRRPAVSAVQAQQQLQGEAAARWRGGGLQAKL